MNKRERDFLINFGKECGADIKNHYKHEYTSLLNENLSRNEKIILKIRKLNNKDGSIKIQLKAKFFSSELIERYQMRLVGTRKDFWEFVISNVDELDAAKDMIKIAVDNALNY